MSGKKRAKRSAQENQNVEFESVKESLEEGNPPAFDFEIDSELSPSAAEEEAEIFVPETSGEGFLPEVHFALNAQQTSFPMGNLENVGEGDPGKDNVFADSELAHYESAEIEEKDFVSDELLTSVIESVLFASDRPVSLASLKLVFKGTNIRSDKIRKTIERLAIEYAGASRGIVLEEVTSGYQLRTKADNVAFLRRTLKSKAFKLSGPALEVLSIVAYKQPVVKYEIDEIRGVESGHLLRALMEKSLVSFEGKSELPGRPMQYGTTKKFLEIFGLRNLKELPTLSEMDQLIPEGIGEEETPEKQSLSSITDSMAETVGNQYSAGEDELLKIEEQLGGIETSSQFFEEEKRRQREKRDQERAQNIREAIVMEEPVSTRDKNWLKKFDEALSLGKTLVQMEEEVAAARLAQMKEQEGDKVSGILSESEADVESHSGDSDFDVATQLEELSEMTDSSIQEDDHDNFL